MEIRGYVDHIIYQNRENGYTVLVVSTNVDDITCVGKFQTIEAGETVELQGELLEHPLYGEQLKVSSYKIVPPGDALSMERYLASGAVKGVGAALAKRIIKKFGEDTFRVMEEEPERLTEVKGISERIAREISMQMEEKKDLRDAMVFLQQYGISNTLAVKIYDAYGPGLYSMMRENPYRMAEDIPGVGFKMADEIASKIGIHTDSDFRIRSGILYTLLQASTDGHVFLPQNQLMDRSAALLDLEAENLENQLSNLAMDQKIVIKKQTINKENGTKLETSCVYAATYYYEELKCARMLVDLNISFLPEDGLLPSEQAQATTKIKRIEDNLNIELDELQREAVQKSMENGVFILSGGPGTGKTTTINTMIRYFEQEGMDIFLAAPTGRAAKRMTEATGYESRTIHRMLEISGGMSDDEKGVHFERNAENPLETDVIIIDEMSMVDIHLLQAMLSATAVGTRLVLVGDVDQLPSVGPGQVLHDMISSHAFPTVILKKIFRQAGESDIVVNAHKINHGEPISLNNKSKDFFFLERNDVNVIYKHMIQLISEKLPKYVNAGPLDIQVLTPMRKGNLGVETLNGILQQYLNPPSPKKKEHQIGENLYREGDKVMQIKNNYQIEWEIVSKYGIPIDKGTGIFNGDMGIVQEINEFSQTMIVEFDEHRRVTYGFAQLEELELAYAVTIHKSQGSEYPAVIMPLLSGPRMLFNRNLLYTAVTRARNCVTILGSSETLMDMIANTSENKRFTSLDKRICEVNA